MSYKFIVLYLAVLFVSQVLQVSQVSVKIDKFLPENDLYIGMYDKSAAGLTEDQFNEVITQVEEVYKPVVSEMGKNLVILRDWEDGTVNSYAWQSGANWYIKSFGGLARHSLMNNFGFMGVVCHELGHHIGGTPKYRNTPWASNEGQSDYFSVAKCVKRVAEHFGLRPELEQDEDMMYARGLCDQVYGVDNISCYIAVEGGKSLGNLLASFEDVVPKYSTPDPKVVDEIQDSHPDGQCRLDTFLAGSLCNKDVTSGEYCDEGLGVRPKCWYKKAE